MDHWQSEKSIDELSSSSELSSLLSGTRVSATRRGATYIIPTHPGVCIIILYACLVQWSTDRVATASCVHRVVVHVVPQLEEERNTIYCGKLS